MEYDEALQDIFTVPRIFGTFPFDRQFNYSKPLLAYCCLLRFLSTFGSVTAFIYYRPKITEDENGGSIDLALRTVGVLSDIGDNFFILIWWFLKRHRISFLMESINEMQKKKKIILERHHVRFVHFLLFFTFFSNILSYCIYRTEDTLLDLLNDFQCFLSFSSTMCFVGQFWDILHRMGFLFRECTQLYDESSVINYERFLTLSEMINEIYGSQILFRITEYFLQIIVLFYILLLPLYPGLNPFNILIIVHTVTCLMPIVSIILACNYYIKQERNFNDDLRRRMIEEKSRVLLRNEKLNFHFVVAQETTFTACGFFNVDMSLICSMISAATTYLVIVLQYSSENPPGSNVTMSPQHA